MYDFIKANQLNVMLMLCGACGILTVLLFMTSFLPKNRKRILITMELTAFSLLWFDRLAYIYSGDISFTGYIMVRVSNFMVFFLTSFIVFGFDLYLMDHFLHEDGIETLPKRLKVVHDMSILGMALAIVAAFTDLYYYFDDANVYHRGYGFYIAYIIPVLCPLIQFTVIRKYRKFFSRIIYISLVLYIFIPIICGIVQIFNYGISLVNLSMVAVSISLYIFTHIDMNRTVKHAHEIEIKNMQGENQRMKRLFDQIATSFVRAVEKKDEYAVGKYLKIAEYAKKIGESTGKSSEECEQIYYAALFHDVGLIGIPDSIVKKETELKESDITILRQKPLIGVEILSGITEYPFLEMAAHYSHERFDGSGYPEGLKGEEIPEIARIIGVADAYVTMTSRTSYRDAKPDFVARETLVKGSGDKYDPVFTAALIRIIDDEKIHGSDEDKLKPETELTVGEYRDSVSNGILIDTELKRVSFNCLRENTDKHVFSDPSVILFDSYDRRIHNDTKTINAYNYTEYGEVWFDEHSITTAARKIKERVINKGAEDDDRYEIIMGRNEDHVKLIMKSHHGEKEVIMALPDGSKSAYLALTGEHCELKSILVENTGETIGPDDIQRIADDVVYTERMESDVKNVQINKTRSAYTESIELKKRLRIMFHTMTLPGGNLIWQCPYIVLFYSDDGTVNGPDYREYALLKLYGENEGEYKYSDNSIYVKKTERFPGWNEWIEMNKEGLECDVSIKKKGREILIETTNLGIEIKNTTILKDDMDKVYVGLTGDEVALTDIRIK